MSYIRRTLADLLLSEGAKSTSDLPDQTYVTVEKTRDGVLVYFSDLMGQISEDPLTGIVEAYEPDDLTGPCDGALVVRRAFVTGGFGPMLYDLAMEAAGKRGLTMDRDTLTQEAFKVWKFYKDNRVDVKAIPLTDCVKGPRLDIYQMEYEEGESPIDFRYVKKNKSVTGTLRAAGKLIEA